MINGHAISGGEPLFLAIGSAKTLYHNEQGGCQPATPLQGTRRVVSPGYFCPAPFLIFSSNAS
jgi:hypothetical protein